MMLRWGAEHHMQKALDGAGTNWNKTFLIAALISTDIGLQIIRQTASAGAQSDLMNNERWGRRCMRQLQEAENWNRPAATTWATEFLLREDEIRKCLGSWINSNVVNEAKKRLAKQVITCSFPYGKWLYRIGAHASPGCELCKKERRKDMVSLADHSVLHCARLLEHGPSLTYGPSRTYGPTRTSVSGPSFDHLDY